MIQRKLLTGVLMAFLVSVPAQAQLNRVFDTLFDNILREGFRLSPGEHANHFLPAAEEASNALTPALNSLIAGNISSFPLSSNVAGVIISVVDGKPLITRGSMGPIVAETAETLSPGELVVGFNATHLSLNSFRGLPLEDMGFTFLHADIGAPGLGDSPNESDIVNISLGLEADANIFVLYAAYGVAPNLDVALAIPFVNVRLKGEARAVVESFTFVRGGANHFFDGTSEDPDLEKITPYNESAAGVGNIALQLKYRLPSVSFFDAGLLLDVRVPSGDEGDFLGTGNASVRGLLLVSGTVGDFTPHLNFGYDYHGGADFDSDELEVVVGFSHKLAEGLTFALDFLGDFDLEAAEAIHLLPGEVTITDHVPVPNENGETVLTHVRTISRSNVRDQNYDHTLNASVGMWIAPTNNFQLLTNLIIPLQDDGLRSSVALTVGLSLSF